VPFPPDKVPPDIAAASPDVAQKFVVAGAVNVLPLMAGLMVILTVELLVLEQALEVTILLK
jgi:hypothetical protein